MPVPRNIFDTFAKIKLMARQRSNRVIFQRDWFSFKFAACRFILMSLFSVFVTHGVANAEVNPLQITLIPEVRKVETHGSESRVYYVPAKTISQGEEIYYTVRIVNLANDKVKRATVVQPVPSNTHLVDRSVTGAGAAITYSIDGGKTFISAGEMRNALDDRAPLPVRVTHIRWQFRHALAPHVVVFARFRVLFD
jgi:uncharacterized repeat protein (TIGR01451 family)